MVLSEVVCTSTTPCQLFRITQQDCNGPVCHYVDGYKYGSVAKKILDANIRYMNTRCGVSEVLPLTTECAVLALCERLLSGHNELSAGRSGEQEEVGLQAVQQGPALVILIFANLALSARLPLFSEHLQWCYLVYLVVSCASWAPEEMTEARNL